MSSSYSPRLRFSMATLLVIVAACAVGLWWWQLPYTVETPEPLRYFDYANGNRIETQGRRVETFRRRMFEDPKKHGPTRVYDVEGLLIFEEWWQEGIRHGTWRRWSPSQAETPAELLVELEFEVGRLVRVDGQLVDDFMVGQQFPGKSGERIREALHEETDLSYLDVPLPDVIDDLQLRHDIPMLPDNQLADDLFVTSEIGNLPLFAGLCSMVAPLDLTCHFRHEVLWVTTPEHQLDVERLRGVDGNAKLETLLQQEASLSFLDVPFEEALAATCGPIRFANRSNSTQVVRLETGRLSRRAALGILLHKQGCIGEMEGEVLVVRDDEN